MKGDPMYLAREFLHWLAWVVGVTVGLVVSVGVLAYTCAWIQEHYGPWVALGALALYAGVCIGSTEYEYRSWKRKRGH